EGFAVPEKTLLTYNPATKRIYIHLMDYNTQTLVLPGYRDKIKYAQFLHDASELRYKEQGNDIVLTLPAGKPAIEVPVIELLLK
ncbi:alpha-L-fucosidase, partial [Terrimonas sp. R1]